jgi:hypothetical protein
MEMESWETGMKHGNLRTRLCIWYVISFRAISHYGLARMLKYEWIDRSSIRGMPRHRFSRKTTMAKRSHTFPLYLGSTISRRDRSRPADTSPSVSVSRSFPQQILESHQQT